MILLRVVVVRQCSFLKKYRNWLICITFRISTNIVIWLHLIDSFSLYYNKNNWHLMHYIWIFYLMCKMYVDEFSDTNPPWNILLVKRVMCNLCVILYGWYANWYIDFSLLYFLLFLNMWCVCVCVVCAHVLVRACACIFSPTLQPPLSETI